MATGDLSECLLGMPDVGEGEGHCIAEGHCWAKAETLWFRGLNLLCSHWAALLPEGGKWVLVLEV